MHPALPSIVEAASRDFVVFITTSGYGVSGKILDRIRDNAILVFGLDGIGETHDYYRGVPRSFATVIRAMELTRSRSRTV